MDFQTLSVRTVASAILEQITAMIRSGEIKPGDRLPSESALSEKLGITSSLVRNALSLLGGNGFITDVSTDELSITEACAALAQKGWQQPEPLDEATVSDMYEVRKVLEPATVRFAARNATPEDLARIRETLGRMERCLTSNDPEEGAAHDAAFHTAIAEASHNSYMSQVVHMLTGVFRTSVSAGRKHLYSESGGAEAILEQHRAIYDALAKRQATAAEQAMLVHLTYAQKKKHWS
jgi:GntR family transcriptional repressor for pyruvate dehydrogenase complex